MLTRSMSDQAPNIMKEHAEERPACLVLHGLGGGPYELGPLLECSGPRASRSLALSCRGMTARGQSCRRLRWDEWAAAAESGFDELAASGRKVAVIGFSTGATVALHLATQRPVAR